MTHQTAVYHLQKQSICFIILYYSYKEFSKMLVLIFDSVLLQTSNWFKIKEKHNTYKGELAEEYASSC